MKLSEILMRVRRILGCFQSEIMKVREDGGAEKESSV